MSATAELAHQSRNRIRVRIPSRRKDSAWFRHLSGKLQALPQVEQVESNPLTGSVLIFHSGPHKALLKEAERLGLFHIARREKKVEPWSEGIFRKLDASNERISQATDGSWDLPTLAATGMIGLGILQALRSEFLPPAWTLMADALEVLSKNRNPRAELSEVLNFRHYR